MTARNWIAFALFCEMRRVHRGLSVAAAAAGAGVSPQVFGRATSALPLAADNFTKLCAWAGEDPVLFADEARGLNS